MAEQKNAPQDMRPLEQHPDDAPQAPIVEQLSAVHPADAADHLEDLPLAQRVEAVAGLNPEDAADTIAEMDTPERRELITTMTPKAAGEIIAEMSPDDAADLLDELPDNHCELVLEHLDKEHAEEIRELMAYDPDTAGGVMNTEVIELDERLTVDQAIQIIRRRAEEQEVPYYAYLVDDAERLAGVLSMRDLLVSRPGTILKTLIKDQSLVSVTFDMDKEEVARLISHYNFLAIPVTDYDDHLLGIVTIDDVIDIIHEEATEDMQTMVGAGADETTDSPWHYSVRKRLPWLVVNLFNSAISASVVAMFEGTIEQMAVLAVLLPIVSNQAGNTGQQALAVMIRQLAMDTFDRKRALLAVGREVKIGLVTGLCSGLICTAAVIAWQGNLGLAAIFGAATFLDMVLGCLVGGTLPLLLKWMGRDPAQASCIFLTTFTDTFGFFSVLMLAVVFLLAK